MSNYLLAAIFSLTYFTAIFILAQLKKDNSLIDLAYGPAFAISARLAYLNSKNTIVLPLLISLWAIRLFWHLAQRNLGKGEDYRYRELRKNWGRHPALHAYFKVFLFQAGFQYLIGLSSIAPQKVSLNCLSLLGILIFFFGLALESLADFQLAQFRKRKEKYQILTTGLFAYSRHPNYLGEAILWWGIFILSWSLHGNWLLIISPLSINLLLRYVTGVPFLERRYQDHPQYQAYAQKVPIFLPFRFK